jgi:hypothetical protein
MGSIELTCRDIIEILQVVRKFLDAFVHMIEVPEAALKDFG